MNPPYGQAIPRWVQKADEAGRHGSMVVGLLPARTDTRWWWSNVIGNEIRFLKGRVKFNGHIKPAPFPSALVVFGAPAQVLWLDLPAVTRGFGPLADTSLPMTTQSC